MEEAGRPSLTPSEAMFLEEVSTLVSALSESFERLRSRVLPIIG